MMPDVIEELSEVQGKNTVLVRAGDSTWEIARSAAESLDLHPGRTVTSDMLSQLEAAAQRRAAAALALRFLSRRPRTHFEVRQRLQEANHTEVAIAAVLEELQTRGLVDDERYAAWFVDARLAHRPTGPSKLIHEMTARGVPDTTAAAAVAQAFSLIEEEALAFEAARKRLPSLRRLPRERALRRLKQFLSGRGFSQETVRSVCFGFLERGEFQGHDDLKEANHES